MIRLGNQIASGYLECHDIKLFTSDQERLELLTNFPWWYFGVSQLYKL